MTFSINDFEGPLDLLLHLVKAKKMEIISFDIALITKEYINFINREDNLSIDAYSEYLVMASELIHLKSKSLLSKDDEEDEGYVFESAEDLQMRLLEYEKIKNMAGNFKELEEKRGEVYTKLPSSLSEFKEDKTIVGSDITLNDLLGAFEAFLARQKYLEPKTTKITKKELNLEERCSSIRNLLRIKKGKVKFLELFDDISKPYVIITFLSILDMAKTGEIKITQKNNFSDIFVEVGEEK